MALIGNVTTAFVRTQGTDPINATSAPAVSFGGFDGYDRLLIWIILGTIWTFGLVTNTAAAVTLCRMKPKPLNFFIISLCCSDILSAIVTPFLMKAVVSSDVDFPFGRIVCKIVRPLKTVASAVTIQLVLVLCIWRLFAILRPHKAARFMTLKKAKVVSICSWLISTIVLVPGGVSYLDIVTSSRTGLKICYYIKERRQFARVFTLTVEILISNFIPISCIIVLCIVIAIALLIQHKRRQTVSGGENLRAEEKIALLQVSLIIVSFLVGYIPKFTYYLWVEVVRVDLRTHKISYVVTNGIRNLTESLNPILFVVGSSVLRESTVSSFKGVLSIYWRCVRFIKPHLGDHNHQTNTNPPKGHA